MQLDCLLGEAVSPLIGQTAEANARGFSHDLRGVGRNFFNRCQERPARRHCMCLAVRTSPRTIVLELPLWISRHHFDGAATVRQNPGHLGDFRGLGSSD